MRPGFHIQIVSGSVTPVRRALPALRETITGGADSVQIRDHAASDQDVQALVDGLREPAAVAGCSIVINRRIDLVDGLTIRCVHLAASTLNAPYAFPVPKHLWIGVSVHSPDEAQRAVSLGVDYLTFGHVFETRTHPGVPGRGVGALQEIVSAIDIPVLAIGGITATNVADVLWTGCAGVAVSSAVLGAPSPAHAVTALRAVIARSDHAPRRGMPPIHRETTERNVRTDETARQSA